MVYPKAACKETARVVSLPERVDHEGIGDDATSAMEACLAYQAGCLCAHLIIPCAGAGEEGGGDGGRRIFAAGGRGS